MLWDFMLYGLSTRGRSPTLLWATHVWAEHKGIYQMLGKYQLIRIPDKLYKLDSADNINRLMFTIFF